MDRKASIIVHAGTSQQFILIVSRVWKLLEIKTVFFHNDYTKIWQDLYIFFKSITKL